MLQKANIGIWAFKYRINKQENFKHALNIRMYFKYTYVLTYNTQITRM